MSIYYKDGFYDDMVHSIIPEGAVKITVADYRALLAAQSQGMMIQPDASGYPQSVPLPEPTSEELLQLKQAAIVAAVQARLDAFAKTRNYDNIFTAATYATSKNPQFAAEGQYAVEARDETWARCYQILNEVMTGQRPEPTLEEIMAELPALAWPEV